MCTTYALYVSAIDIHKQLKKIAKANNIKLHLIWFLEAYKVNIRFMALR